MQPNSSQLARRDIALASLLGIVATGGSNFGSEPSFAGEFSADFSDEAGYEQYSGFSADAVEAPKPTPQQALQAYNNQYAAQQNRSQRVRLLNPNKGSDIKVERYSFTIDQALTIGTALVGFTMTGQPDTAIRPQILTMNAPSPMFVTIQEIKVANVSVSIGTGQEDAFNYSALAQSRHLDMPTLTPANRASIIASYTGYVPPGFPALMAVRFSASFKGPATIAG